MSRAARRRARGSFPVPRRAAGPVAGSVLALIAWAAVAHNSGAGWVQALGALLGGFLFVGLVAPAVSVRRARCALVSSPLDVTEGRPGSLVLEVSGPVTVRPLFPPGPECTTAGLRVCRVPFTPATRGVVTDCVVQVASAAPFGLMWWTKRVVLRLARPMFVGPEPGEPDQAEFVAEVGRGDDMARVNRRVGESRGVRPYASGDLRHWIHWPATAHTGALMVREMEGPAAQPVTVRAVLPEDPDAADAAARRALGTVADLLVAGRTVVLETQEATGTVRDTVADVTAAGRRLARTLPAHPTPARVRAPRGRLRTPEPAEPAAR